MGAPALLLSEHHSGSHFPDPVSGPALPEARPFPEDQATPLWLRRAGSSNSSLLACIIPTSFFPGLSNSHTNVQLFLSSQGKMLHLLAVLVEQGYRGEIFLFSESSLGYQFYRLCIILDKNVV